LKRPNKAQHYAPIPIPTEPSKSKESIHTQTEKKELQKSKSTSTKALPVIKSTVPTAAKSPILSKSYTTLTEKPLPKIPPKSGNSGSSTRQKPTPPPKSNQM